MYKTETGKPLEFLWDIDKANHFWQENFLLGEVQGQHTGALKALGIFWVGMCRPGLQIGTPF